MYVVKTLVSLMMLVGVFLEFRKNIKIWAVVLMGSSMLLATAVRAENIRRCVEVKGKEVCFHFFESTSIEFVFFKSVIPEDCQKLRVDFFYYASHLMIPLPEGKEMNGCEKNFGIYFTFPKVEQESVMEARLAYFGKNSEWKSLGESEKFVVYPHDLVGEFRKWSEKNLLIVYDDEGRLTSWLSRMNVRFMTEAVSENTEETRLYVVVNKEKDFIENREKKYGEFMGAHVVYFHERVSILPKVVVSENEWLSRVDVEMKLLDKIDDDPLAQKSIIEVMSLSIKGEEYAY